jgi:hypothetical protein
VLNKKLQMTNRKFASFLPLTLKKILLLIFKMNLKIFKKVASYFPFNFKKLLFILIKCIIFIIKLYCINNLIILPSSLESCFNVEIMGQVRESVANDYKISNNLPDNVTTDEIIEQMNSNLGHGVVSDMLIEQLYFNQNG